MVGQTTITYGPCPPDIIISAVPPVIVQDFAGGTGGVQLSIIIDNGSG
jgi:hypothetical protein